ncbi:MULTISPECIES: META domain-containing protein [Halomonadaceae]|uniref:META domain-containing protein n=1 Tax=Halomonadaceae TaxID=28256 RepID=UPI000C31C43A|nr:META domain-containing protein [Halomonas sp. MES3-P3E]PKG51067.1 META domain-containing protein [Halomonas sp. MES3-P3E]
MIRQLTLCVLISILFVAAGCSSTTFGNHETMEHPDESLINTYWKLVRLDGVPVIAQENFREAHMVLHQDASRLAGATGCNTLMGSYQVENEHIAFNQVATTKRACPAPQMETERNFLAALKQATAWRVEGARLVLSGDNNEQLASFEAVHLY